MAYNSSTLQKLLKEYNKSSIILDFQKLFAATRRNCVEPDLEYIKSIDNSICTQLYENIRYAQYIIYSLYNSEYLQKCKLNINNPIPASAYLIPVYNKLIEDIINNNIESSVIDRVAYVKYIDKLKEVNSNICTLINRIKNNFNNTHIQVGTLKLFNIYESELYIPSSVSEIDNFINAFRYNNKKFLFFSVNKKTKKLEYTIYTSNTKRFFIINNKKCLNTYSKNKGALSTLELTPITINGQYNTKFELLKLPENFIHTYDNILLESFVYTFNIPEFQNDNTEYLDLTKYNVYVFELNNFHNKQYILEGKNDVANGFYNFHKNIGIFNNFNRSIPAITSNTVTLYICRSYIRQLQLYGNKPIKNSKLSVLFYDETTKLLDIFNSLISKQYTIKYNSQVYLIMNVINNTFIKLSKPYLNDNDVINIIEYLKLFNRKFVNSMY
jgi:hypothetical protein